MIPNLHPECGGLSGDVFAYAAHAENPQGFVARVVAQFETRVAVPFTLAEGFYGQGEVAEGAEDEEDGDVGGGVVDGGGGVGDEDGVGGACWDVDLVVSGAWLRYVERERDGREV